MLKLKLATLTVVATSLYAQDIIEPKPVTGNFATDLGGFTDTRMNTWGAAGAVEYPLQFHPPAGYRVRILRVDGDLVAWPKGKPAEGTAAGVLWALHTTGPEGSVEVEPAADNHVLYVQGGVGQGPPVRVAVSQDASDLLEADNKLLSKLAVWLNDTGLIVHLECTFRVKFRYERVQPN